MNDPGADEAIDKAVKDLNLDQVDGAPAEDTVAKDRAKREKQQRDYQDPSLWWFASTGCPLMAGTFGPLANAFSICALVRGWRVYIPPNVGATEVMGSIRIPDPGWLLAVNAVSLAFAIAANAALLLNMSRRLRFKVAQPISVIGFFMAGILLVADTAAMAASPTYHLAPTDPAAPSGQHALTSAFYFGIEAAIIYLIITALMSLTAWGAWRGHFEGGFRLTFAQRTLMLQTMAFVAYLLLGALVYSHIEGWEYLDAFYWADVTLLTIGLGSDFSPKTHTGRSLLFFFAIGGIIIIGLVIGSIRTLVLDRGKRKLSARIMEKKRLRAIGSIDPKKKQIKVGRFKTMRFDNEALSPSKRRQLEFNVMRGVQDNAERDRKWMALSISTFMAAVLWLLGALVFSHSEKPQGWTYFTAVYFCYTSLLTIGYGDEYPASYAGRAFFVLWTLLAVPTLTILISDMSDTVISFFSDFTLWIGSITVLPSDEGFRATIKAVLERLPGGKMDPGANSASSNNNDDAEPEAGAGGGGESGGFVPPDTLDSAAEAVHERETQRLRQGETQAAADVMARLTSHFEATELFRAKEANHAGDELGRDVHFYHVVLTREIRHLTRDLGSTPPKRYTWSEWEYFLRLMDNVPPPAHNRQSRTDSQLEMTTSETEKGNDEERGRKREERDIQMSEEDGDPHLVPQALRRESSIASFANEKHARRFTWLGTESPLLSWQSETEWILERLGITLERELVTDRKVREGKEKRRKPPVGLGEVIKSNKREQERRAPVTV